MSAPLTKARALEILLDFPRSEEIDRGAVIRGERREYRYRLHRIWDDDKPLCVWIMLNPSTADARVDDATINKCMRFAFLWGYGGIVVVNLFAWRATKPAELRAMGIDPIGPENNAFIAAAISQASAVICAWGSDQFARARALAVTEQLRRARDMDSAPPLQCLRLANGGAPWHPLYVPYIAERLYF